ncbi:dCTP deaminase [Dissostichus eleginoides]|uniref:dCTP deaminase n=1 Tax=Dissostichus eleginoides TaxID=100907 RepID=A0AAD9B2G0_DISEL|nr:dCTP deaminase [Dissostichus eleginoides]
MASQCPMCLRDYKSLAQHLKVTHKVQNKEERAHLVMLAGGRLNVRCEQCPVPFCAIQKGSRLDRHLNSHTELSSAAKRKLVERLKRRLMLATLGRLRATNPTVPMVSRLDLDPAEEQLSPPPPQTLEASPSSSFRSTEFPDHVTVLNCLLEDFKVLQEGPDPSPKLKNNVQSKLHRIRKFVGWMSRGKTDLGKLQFLGDLDNLRGWVKSLRGNKMALPTTLHYLKNVRQFVVFIGETPPTSSRLSKKGRFDGRQRAEGIY